MDIFVYNRQLQIIGVIDSFITFIWTERYSSYGDFEFFVPSTDYNYSLLKANNYIGMKDSDRLMIIEKRETSISVDSGRYLKVSGRSLESILTRRIAWGLVNYAGNLQDSLEDLFNKNAINPSIANRKINNLVFIKSTDFDVTSKTINVQYLGETLYDIVSGICKKYGLGFKIEFKNNRFEFSLYAGENRTFNQSANSYVVFSKSFDNLIDSNYVEDGENYKNAALIGGEGEGEAKMFVQIGDEYSDLNRFETYVDASSISQNKDKEDALTDQEYAYKLLSQGTNSLVNTGKVIDIDATIDYHTTFVVNRDYFLGDKVQIIDDQNIDSEALIEEIILSIENSGTSMYPTFSIEPSSILPEEYQRLEYIGATDGNSWIDTGYFPTAASTCEFEFKFDARPDSESCIMSAYGGSAEIGWQGGYLDSTHGFFTGRGVTYSQNSDILAWTKAFADGAGRTGSEDKMPNTVSLFAQKEASTITHAQGNKKIKNCTIRESGAIVIQLVPCYRRSDGKIGMYDMARNVFLVNSGSGTFVKGPEL